MNRVTLIGNLTRDPELRSMGQSDRQVCDLRVAVSNGPERDPTFIDVSTFDGSAKACAEHLSKGRQVAVDGRLVLREWEAEDGSKRSRHSVIGRVQFLGSPKGAQPASEDGGDEDISF